VNFRLSGIDREPPSSSREGDVEPEDEAADIAVDEILIILSLKRDRYTRKALQMLPCTPSGYSPGRVIEQIGEV
jgi:hypothetical protein